MDGNWATRTVCRQCGKSAHRIRAAAKQAHEKEENKRSGDSPSGSGQKTIAKLEEHHRHHHHFQAIVHKTRPFLVLDPNGRFLVMAARVLVSAPRAALSEFKHHSPRGQRKDRAG